MRAGSMEAPVEMRLELADLGRKYCPGDLVEGTIHVQFNQTVKLMDFKVQARMHLQVFQSCCRTLRVCLAADTGSHCSLSAACEWPGLRTK